jgi:hypothetical protein
MTDTITIPRELAEQVVEYLRALRDGVTVQEEAAYMDGLADDLAAIRAALDAPAPARGAGGDEISKTTRSCGDCKHFSDHGYKNHGSCLCPIPAYIEAGEDRPLNTVWRDGSSLDYAKDCNLYARERDA